MKALKYIALATLILALTSIIVVAQQQDSVEDRLKGFDSYMDQMMNDWNAPGIGIGIVKGDKLVFAKGYGFRDYGKKLPYTTTTTQPIASNSKLFTAVAVGLLVEQGKLRWDDPVKQFVPSIRFYNDELDRSVTIRDMLSHRTGVTRGDKDLNFDFHGIKMPPSHFHYDRFDTPDDEEDGKFSLNFRTNPMGEIEGVEISMDEAAVTFTRRVPADLSKDATLQTYAGTYSSPSGGKTVLTFQPGKGLAIRGGPDLQPWRPHQFRVKEFPDVVISFTVEGGKVLAMRQRDPSGEFVFQRSP